MAARKTDSCSSNVSNVPKTSNVSKSTKTIPKENPKKRVAKNPTNRKRFVAKLADDIFALKPKPEPKPENFRYFVMVSFRKNNGKTYTSVCANIYQLDSGHPNESFLMSWTAASYTQKMLSRKNPDAKYTIHRIYPAVQLEPKR